MNTPIRYLSVCSGMEAASVAWEPLGFHPVGFSEIEPFPCAILKHRFPNTPNYGSLTEHTFWPIAEGAVDLLVGGTPCQSFSVAGLRKGMSDPRGNLALTFLALADRVKPKWIVWENVPGVLSSNGGNDFASFLGALGQLGYGWAYRVLDAQYFGVPQRRRRVFVVACLGNSTAPAEVLSIAEGLRGYIEKGNKKRKGVATDAGKGVEADGSILWNGSDQPNAERLIDKSGTLNCNKGQRGGYICPIPFRKSKRAQSTTDDESWVKAEASNTLNNFDLGDTRTTHAVVEPKDPIISPTITTCKGSRGGCSDEALEEIKAIHLAQQEPVAFILDSFTSNSMLSDNPNSGCREADRTKSLDTSCLNPACNQGGVMIAQPISIQGTIIGRSETAGPQGVGAQEGGPMYTLTKTDIHGVLYENHAQDSRVDGPLNVAPTVAAKFGTGGGNVPLVNEEPVIMENNRRDAIRLYEGTSPTLQSFMGTGGCNVPMVQPAMAVRRLTPVECERLQGFPDNWSRISWKGKPEEDCPDGPRYKACGNSMAVPVMRWIGERIKAVDATLSK